jgi:hypothetical protein
MNKKYKHAYQYKLLVILNDFSSRGKWNELNVALKYMNRILTRHYIDIYWKYLFQYVSMTFPKSIESIPSFIE